MGQENVKLHIICMSTNFTFSGCTRIMSLVLMVSLAVLGFLFRKDMSAMEVVCQAIFLSVPVLLPAPLSDDSHRLSFLVSLSVALVVALLYLAAGLRPCSVAVVSAIGVSMFHILRIARKYMSKRNMFLCESVWQDIEDCSTLIMLIMYFMMSSLSFLLDRTASGPFILLPLAAMLFYVSYYKAYSGRTLLMKPSDERKIRETLSVTASPGPDIDDEMEIPRMNALYTKVLTFMDERQMFLDPDLDIRTLAAALFSNRTYLSRTINAMSGKSFPQFVNTYRVRYALKLIERNPRLKVNEIASMSGFNSGVTFTMAFKMALGTTPSAYIAKYVEENVIPGPSRKKEPEQ